tara:strand:- start:85 stop:453 length:369 start_codon:yes stop_codon:yes gene_type:complete
MDNYKIRFARKKDFDYFFTKEDPALYSAKAWVFVNKKDRLAIGGVWLKPGQTTSFVKIKGEIPIRKFWKISKDITEKLKETKLPIICFRDESYKNSKKYLEKLGYVYYNTLNNQEIYKLWHQ